MQSSTSATVTNPFLRVLAPAGRALARLSAPAGRALSRVFAEWTTRDIVVAAVLSVVIGVVFWAWSLLWTTVFAMVPFPVSYLSVGLWMIGGLLVPYVIRKPGAAFLGEVVAAFVSMSLGNQWGILTMASGLVQGAGAEIVFGLARWHDFRGAEFKIRRLRIGARSLPFPLWRAGSGVVFYGAAGLAGAFSILLDTFVYSYHALYSWTSIGVAAILCIVSSLILGGVLAQLLGEALARTGVLSGLEISRGRVKRI